VEILGLSDSHRVPLSVDVATILGLDKRKKNRVKAKEVGPKCLHPVRVPHEITGTIGRPRFVIGARRDEGA